ncbi:hypothetical protein ACFLSU_07625 [Bacteroidota bacterium]
MSLQGIVILSIIFAIAIPSSAKYIGGFYKQILSALFQLIRIVITNAASLFSKILSLIFKGLGFLFQHILISLGAIFVGIAKLSVEIIKGLFLVLKALLKFLIQQISNLFNRK